MTSQNDNNNNKKTMNFMLLWFDHEKCGICLEFTVKAMWWVYSTCVDWSKWFGVRAQNWSVATRWAKHRYNQLYMAIHLHDNVIMVRTDQVRIDRWWKRDKLVRQCKLHAFDGICTRLVVCTWRIATKIIPIRSPFHAAIVSIFVDVMFCCVYFGIFFF